MNIVNISHKKLKNRNKKALKSFKKYSPIVKKSARFPARWAKAWIGTISWYQWCQGSEFFSWSIRGVMQQHLANHSEKLLSQLELDNQPAVYGKGAKNYTNIYSIKRT